jgi:hypothetical protein
VACHSRKWMQPTRRNPHRRKPQDHCSGTCRLPRHHLAETAARMYLTKHPQRNILARLAGKLFSRLTDFPMHLTKSPISPPSGPALVFIHIYRISDHPLGRGATA